MMLGRPPDSCSQTTSASGVVVSSGRLCLPLDVCKVTVVTGREGSSQLRDFSGCLRWMAPKQKNEPRFPLCNRSGSVSIAEEGLIRPLLNMSFHPLSPQVPRGSLAGSAARQSCPCVERKAEELILELFGVSGSVCGGVSLGFYYSPETLFHCCRHRTGFRDRFLQLPRTSVQVSKLLSTHKFAEVLLALLSNYRAVVLPFFNELTASFVRRMRDQCNQPTSSRYSL